MHTANIIINKRKAINNKERRQPNPKQCERYHGPCLEYLIAKSSKSHHKHSIFKKIDEAVSQLHWSISPWIKEEGSSRKVIHLISAQIKSWELILLNRFPRRTVCDF